VLQSGYYGAGVVWGAQTERDPAWMSRNLAELLRWWEQGKLKPLIAKTFPLPRPVRHSMPCSRAITAERWCWKCSAEKRMRLPAG
jgi:NADPH:quinone reductase-like Zn-dependent oxidoreductase